MKNWFSYLFVLVLMFGSFSVQAEVVNINKADAAAMQHYLAGIGEKKAKSIVKYRKDNGDFKEIEDIMEVKGIGEGIFKKIKSDISTSKGVTKAPEKKKESNKPKESEKTKKPDDKDKASKKVEDKKSDK